MSSCPPCLILPIMTDLSVGFGYLSTTVSAPFMRCGVFNRPVERSVWLLIEIDAPPPVMQAWNSPIYHSLLCPTWSTKYHSCRTSKESFQCGQAKLEISVVNKVLNFTLGLVQGHMIEPSTYCYAPTMTFTILWLRLKFVTHARPGNGYAKTGGWIKHGIINLQTKKYRKTTKTRKTLLSSSCRQ